MADRGAKGDARPDSRWRHLAVNAALLLGSLLLAATFGEVLVRIAAPQQLILKRPDIWTADSTLGYRHQTSVRTTVNTGEGAVTFLTDQDGFRVARTGRREGDLTVLLLGDSFMEALQVEYEQSLAGLLDSRLSRAFARPVAVRNAGVGGWDPDVYLIAADALLSRQRFDLVVVALYTGNDIIDYWRKRVPARVPEEVHHFHMPRRWSLAGLTDAALYPINDALEVRSQLFVFLKNHLQGLRMRLGLTAAEFPVVFRRAEATSGRWRNTADICARIAGRAREAGIATIFVLIPAPHQVDRAVFREYVRGFGIDTSQIDLEQPSRILGEEVRKRGLSLIDALPLFERSYAEGAQLYGRIDNHLSPKGHEVLAGVVESAIVTALHARRRTSRFGTPEARRN